MKGGVKRKGRKLVKMEGEGKRRVKGGEGIKIKKELELEKGN